MGEHTSTPPGAGEKGRSTLGELIHAAVRGAIEAAVEAELVATLGADRYERRDSRQGYRNGTKTRTLSGPTCQYKFLMRACRRFDTSANYRSHILRPHVSTRYLLQQLLS
jgi:hypothetical protein